jgi:hypothetical protein
MADCDEFPELYFPDDNGVFPWDYASWNDDKEYGESDDMDVEYSLEYGILYLYFKEANSDIILGFPKSYRQGKVFVSIDGVKHEEISIPLARSFLNDEMVDFVNEKINVNVRKHRYEGIASFDPETYFKTYQLIHQKCTLEEMANMRGLKISVIVEHIGKLLPLHPSCYFEYLRPPIEVLNIIISVYTSIPLEKARSLTYLFEKLNKQYPIWTIRLAMIFHEADSRSVS